MGSKNKAVAIAAKPKGPARIKKNLITTASGEIAIYATPRISKIIDEVVGEMALRDGARILNVIEAAYVQGKKDGARIAFGEIEKGVKAAQKVVPHKNPGKPKRA